MQKMTVRLPPDLHRALKEMSKQTGRSRSALMRDAVDAYCQRLQARLPQSLGMGSDPELSSTDIDAWLRDNWRPD
jgi:metal-responsive CopG/Arc/MetJ family transcriptional regulator